MFNRPSQATNIPYTDPVLVNGVETYPADQDYLLRDIKPLYEKYGVIAVSFDHSHVYDRYLFNGVNYIEAASMAIPMRITVTRCTRARESNIR